LGISKGIGMGQQDTEPQQRQQKTLV
jgi:hypothetical protein